jgi:hypothetical protein
MNFKIKALVAAAAVAMTGVAHADIVDFTEAGGGSLLLSIWNANDAVSALFDLGPTMDSFNGNLSQSWDLTSGAYADAWAQIAPSLSGATFMVFAGDITGVDYFQHKFFSTVGTGSTALTNSQVRNMAEVADFVVASELAGNHASVADGANVSASTTAYQGTKMKTDWNGRVPFVSTAAIGDAVDFYSFQGVPASGRTAGAAAADVVAFAGTFSQNANGTLTYAVAAVPEPETYAMLLAGLGLIGGIARRRAAR